MKSVPQSVQEASCLPKNVETSLMRTVVLVVMTIQNCSLMMVTSYSRAMPGPKYLTSTAVLAGELVKTVVVLGVLMFQHGLGGTKAVIRQDIFSSKSQTLRYAVPAIFYTLQNNLWYYAMSNLDSVSAAVVSQTKILSTAVFSMIILSRALNKVHWSALGLLMLGLGVMKAGSGAHDSSGGHYLLGVVSMVAACTSSGYAGVYLEMLFKQLNSSVWTSNMQLQLFCLPIAALAMLSDFQGLVEGGLFYGWSSITCVVVLLNALGGFVVSLTMKYADNILKTFAVSMSLVANCLLSSAFQAVHLPPQAIAGVGMVIVATFLYSIANSAGIKRAVTAAVPEAPKEGYLSVSKALDVEDGFASQDEVLGAEELQIIGRATAAR